MAKKSILFLLLVWLALPLSAEDAEHRGMNPHMLRIGWGDQLFEHVGWHNSPQPINVMPASYSQSYNENFRYTQHWFIEYQNRYNRWFSYGGMIDGSGVVWDQVTRNGKGAEIERVPSRSFCNIVIMPTIYFTYFHHQYVSMHSGLGIGMDINSGTEKDFRGRKTVVSPVTNLTLFGVSAGYKKWFACVELGGMIALTGGQSIYLFGSRLVSVSTGVTF